MLSLILLISAAALVITRDLSGDLAVTANVTAKSQYLAGEVDSSASEMTALERGAVLAAVLGEGSQVAQNQQKFAANATRLQSALAELHKTASGAEAASLLATLDQQTVLVLRGHEELRRAMSNSQMDVALVTFAQKVAPSLVQIGEQATSLVEQQNRDLQATSAAAASKSSRSIAITLALTILALAVGGAVFMLVLNTNRSLLHLSSQLAGSAQQVAGAAAQVSGASQSLAQGAGEQAASLEETSASTEEIASITRQNADHALQVAGLMQKSADGAGAANEMLDRMVEKMKEIDGSSRKIARIIKVIDEIAFQTNILALNAAVEAARAGEAGLGFAVVADEVRNLAQRCAQAARDTAGLIEESIATSQDGSGRLDLMAGAVRSMTESSVRVKSLVDDVNHGSQEQARGMEQIASAILHMEQVTQKTAASAQEGASAGCQLNEYAAGLRSLVDEMREMVGAS
jgi:methyl-accepting chemotaxis protein/methyl-accepting chemotaxis protein-1 (serine sensor receptor)